MNGAEEVSRAREQLLRCALADLLAERQIATTGNAVSVVKTDEALCLAAQRLARAVDERPIDRQPKGWHTQNSLPAAAEGSTP